MIDGALRVALRLKELRGGVLRGGNFGNGRRGAGAGVRFQPRQICEIDGVVVDRESRDFLIASNRLDVRSWRVS